jgi:hypothetical protein
VGAGPAAYNGSMAAKKSQTWLYPFFLGIALIAVSRIVNMPFGLQLALSIAALLAFVVALVVGIRARSQRSSSS